MKKRILFVFMLITIFCNIAFSLTLADLDIEEKILVEDRILAEDTEITPATLESLEGIKYDVIFKDNEYIIFKVGDKFIILQK